MWTAFCAPSKKGGGVQPKFFPGKNDPSEKHRTVIAHRWIWETVVGPIPEGYEVDHVKSRGCKGRPCVEISHLEPVPPEENARRTRGDVCRSGKHDLTDPSNALWSKDGKKRYGCRLCKEERRREYLDEIYEARGGRQWRADVCRAGKHDLTIEANLLVDKRTGKRRGCRPCQLEKKRAASSKRYYANLEAIRAQNREYHRRKKLQREQG